jgi:hypothetical protein
MSKQLFALLLVGALLPTSAAAFSFGTFAPADTIIEIELSAAVSSGVTFDTGADPDDPSDDTLTFESSVSTITMASGAVFSPTLGDVLVSSTVMPIAASEQFFPTIIGAEFANGVVADLSITDIGIGGSGLLLEADYLGSVSFTASQFFSGFPISGSLSGEFEVTGGDTDFTTAFGPQGDFFSTLAGWLVTSTGSAPSALCQLTNGWLFGSCLLPQTDFASFTANPTTTIVPIAVPEPGTLVLFGAIAAAVGVTRRR